jgi:hypothetical protein
MRLELRLPADLLSQVDVVRGDVPRAAFVRRALENAVGVADGFPPVPAAERTDPVGRTPRSEAPVSEEAPAADTRATESRVRPASPRSQPKAQRRQKASDAMSAALARQQALNKSKGI